MVNVSFTALWICLAGVEASCTSALIHLAITLPVNNKNRTREGISKNSERGAIALSCSLVMASVRSTEFIYF